MNHLGKLSLRYLKIGLKNGLIAALIAGGGCDAMHHGQAGDASVASAQAPAIPPLSADDVSLLFPAPTQAADFAKLIAVGDLTSPNAQDPTKRDPVWSSDVFQQFVAIAGNPAFQVSGAPAVGLPPEAQTIGAWFIAGIRVDAGAPGLSSEIRAQFGQRPEIRLIIQPVTPNPDGTPNVHDLAGHLIFDFILGTGPAPDGCSPPAVPDLVAFNTIVAELATLRTKLANGKLGANKVVTAGLPLGVHPGLADATTAANLRLEIKSFLERHISAKRLNAMAMTVIPPGKAAPWSFLAMINFHPGQFPPLPNGGVVPLPGPTLDGKLFAELLQPAGTPPPQPRVVPQPHTNNQNPITCRSAASPVPLPVAGRNGVSTSDIFAGTPLPGQVQTTVDVIADPTKSHFFNTDCVSCHTETRRSMDLSGVKTIPGIDTAALPNGQWDIRNFGWALAPKGAVQATVTRRTAAETAAVLSFINSQLPATPSLSATPH